MGNSIITPRCSRADALRSGIQPLRENEKKKSLSDLVHLRRPKPEFTLEDIIKELDENLLSEGESGDLIEASRER